MAGQMQAGFDSTELDLSTLADDVSSLAAKYDKIIDDTTTANVTYVGRAAIGSSTASAVWQIFRIDESAGFEIGWADSTSDFSKTWNSRASYTYSK